MENTNWGVKIQQKQPEVIILVSTLYFNWLDLIAEPSLQIDPILHSGAL